MIKVCGYTLKEELCRSNDSILYRGERDKDNEPVLVKTYNTIGNKSSCIEKLKQELLNLSNHRIEGFLSLYGVGSYSDGIVLVFQDFKGIPIVEYFQKYHWGIIQFLDVAIQFIEILINIQKSNIIHKVRSPENILYDHESGRIKIIDSGISHFLTKEDDYLSNPDLLIKTLPYTSPEEHSLLHMTPNFSSDLYLAGVLFYELITGEKPFQRESPIEIINSNLTENAPSIFELAPEVPSIVGKIILKMIENQQEERYRTGKGLIFDLERCREEYINSGKISDFTLGSRDLVDKIFLPSKIFGRKNEIDIIKKEYKKVQNGDFRTLLISGQPGIGKTRLVEELQGFFIEKGSYYIDWKCCKDRNDLSYDMIMQAFAKFIRRLLSEDEEEVERCRERIIDAVGINGTLIIEKIPDLEKLIGVQPDVEPLPPTRAKNRFKDIFNSFVGSLPSKEHPLVIFIDDLQWCDLSSFMFISDMLASNEEKKYIYLLGAYQNNKLEANHPLKNLIMRAKESEWPVDIIRLEPLNADDCHRMISNMTGSNNTELKPLIKFISDVSLGNPNLIVDVLLSFQKEGILCLNDENQWNWDIRSIHKIDLPEDIIGPFLSRIETLPANTRDLLKLCACMGYQFSIVDFCEAVDMEKSVVFADLSPAVEIGVLIIDENSISFIHKKLHQAIRQNIPKDEFKKINRRIGNKLLSIIPRGVNPEGVDNLFTIVDHLNDGINKNLNRISVFKLARLNYYAGNRALKYFNFEISNKYFRQSVRLLSDDYWDSYYEFRFSSYINLARSEMAIGNHKESLALLDILLERSINDLDKIECLVVQSANLLSIGEYYIAIETLNKGLEYFNNSIPIDAESVRIKIDEYAGTIDDYSIDPFEIINKETSFSRRDLILFSLYNNLIPAYYSIGQVDKFFLAALQSVKLCLNTGIHYKAIYPFSVYLAFLLEKGNFHKAFRYEDLIIHLCRKYPDSSGQTRGLSSI
ncbi:MAG: AAA family ATPase, partial [Spirochaetota bacterium]|nr:AAA family ATPase [Spirochaetota bacterium]